MAISCLKMFVRNFLQLAIIECLLLHNSKVEASFKEFIKFKQVDYENLPSKFCTIMLLNKFFRLTTKILFKDSGNFPFIPYNNVPQGFAPYISKEKSKVFIAVPRRSPGVPSTLNYVKLEDSSSQHGSQSVYQNPKLHSYPNYAMNELDVSAQRFFMLN